MKSGKSKTAPWVNLVAKVGGLRSLAVQGAPWGVQACNRAVTRIKQCEEEAPSASAGCAACSLATSQRCFLALLV